jgi:putative NADH-flavin reductase
MKKLIVFGATGGTGLCVVQQALDTGYDVTVVVRQSNAFLLHHDHLHIIEGDVLNPTTFEHVIEKDSAIISCLGIRKREPTVVYSQGVANILKVMKKQGADRIVCLSAIAVTIPPKGSLFLKFVTRYILQPLFKHLYDDMLRMEVILRESDMNWTVIRPPQLIDGEKKGKYRVSINEALDRPSKITRSDLADFIINKCLESEQFFRKRVEIST